jgi:thymidylate synthase
MLDGILDFEVEAGKWHYTYHKRFENQLQFVSDELKRNPESRRAIMSIRDNGEDMGSDSPACLQSIQYFIRGGSLHCKVLFRSNDAAKAAFMNAFALIMLQKRFADELGVTIGSYAHRANSFHCYEKDWELLGGYIKRIAAGDVTYDYAGDWDEQMEEAKPEIAETVRILKEER